MKKVGLNGLITDAGEAVISVYDHGFLYGLGLFETFRTYGGGRPFLLERHLDRLRRGCAELGIPFVMTDEEVRGWIRELLAANGLEEGYIRLTVSAGEEALGLPSGDYSAPTVVLMAKELPQPNDEQLLRGRELRLLRTRRNSPEGAVRNKSLHYMNNILARRELLGLSADMDARQNVNVGEGMASEDVVEEKGVRVEDRVNAASAKLQGRGDGVASEEVASKEAGKGSQGPFGKPVPPAPGTEGLMLSEQGFLTEGIVSNLFFARGGIVFTPAVGTGILPGITRQRVLELAVEAGYQVEEGFYALGDLQGADEIWMTNSIQELIPITSLTDAFGEEMTEASLHAVSREQRVAGPITRKLLARYRTDTVQSSI
ncbi:aminotransferase class IV [Paenibacillus sp. HB172176]|uniref:aminotransferase class IV n=1 Tax=Paenibacillus sp. HB172176 TaxID=2493690 RepID=UPI003211E9EC